MTRLTLQARVGASRWACAAALLWLALSSGPAAHAQARPLPPIENGSLLVAHAELQDAAFTETVVLVLRHDEVGTVGLIVNRPTSLDTGTVFPDLAEALTTYEGRLYRGGPAQPTRPLALVQGLAAVVAQGPEIVDRIYLSVDTAELGNIVRVAKDESSLRIYAGHTEWAPGQIEEEVARGIWRVVRGNAALVFSADPTALWQEATALATGGVVADARGTGAGAR